MNTLNVRLLGGLALGLVLLGAGGYFVHGYQMRRHAGAYLREARRAQEANRPQEAVQHFRRYVKLAPEDTEGLALYGLQLADLDQLQPAYLLLDQALRREPAREDWRRRLVETAFGLERYSDARANLEEHLLKRHPRDPALLVQLGRCHVALGDNDVAAKTFEAAVAAAPQQVDAYVHLAGLHETRFKDSVEAERWLDRMIAANAVDHRAYLIRGQWRLDNRHRSRTTSAQAPHADAAPDDPAQASTAETKTLAAAQEDARKALELAPNDTDALLFASRLTAVGGQHAEARKLAVRALESRSDATRPYMLLAEIETAAGDDAAAIDWLRRGAEAIPRDQDLRWNLARLLVDSGRGPEAAEELKPLRQAGHPPARLDYLEARIAIAAQKWRDGIRGLEQARPALAPWPELTKQADFWLGRCHEQLGNPDQQLVALRRAVAADPSFVAARLDLAGALLATGQVQEAQEHYRHVASLPSAPTVAGLRLAQLLVVANLRREPSQREWTSVDQILSTLEKATPDSPEVILLRAEVLVAQERTDEAKALLDAARRRDPKQLEFVAAQIVLADRAGDPAQVDQLLRDAEADADDPVAVRLLKGRTLVQRDKAKAAAALRELWNTSEALPAEKRSQLAEGLAALALTVDDLDLAFELGTFAAAAQPNDLRLRLLLFDVAIRSGKPERLDELLAEVRRIEGDGPLWHYGQALKLVGGAKAAAGSPAAGSPAAALDELAKARALRPGWSRPVLLTAEIFDRQGDASRATDAYLEAISLGERDVPAIARAVTLLFEQKRFVEADQVVRRMQEQQGVFTGAVTRLAAETSLRLEEFDRASDLAQTFAVESDRLQDHTWAGQMLDLLGRYDEAETRLHRAIEIDPKASEPRIALVGVLVHAGRSADAETAIADAQAAVDADQTDVTAAQCYEIVGRAAEAEKHYRNALARTPDDAVVMRRVIEFFLKNKHAAEAEPLLRRIVAAEIPASKEDQEWARRSLAVTLGTRGGRQRLEEALGLLDANRTDGQPASADTRARAVILASQPSSESRRNAIELLERLLADERTAVPDDRFLLAELLRRGGDSARAAAELRNVLAARPDESRYVSAYVQTLLDLNQTSEAELWTSRLKEISPDELVTADLESRVLFATARPDQAAAILTRIATSASGDAAAERRLWAAERLTNFSMRLRDSGKSDVAATLATEAEALFVRHLGERPDDALLVAKHRARLGRIDDAIAVLAAPPAAAKPESLEALAVAIMTSPAATSEQLAQLQKSLDQALERSDRAVPLLVVSADLLGWRGEYADAETRYRELLKRDGGDIRVLNNLALVLALGQKRYDEGLVLIDRALEIAGPQGALLDTRGLVQLAAGRSTQAQADFKLAIDQSSAPDRYLHLAAAQWQSRDKDRAQQTLKKAESLGLAWAELHPLERPLLAGLRSELR